MLKRLPLCKGIIGFGRHLSSWTCKHNPSHRSTRLPRTEHGNPRHHAAGRKGRKGFSLHMGKLLPSVIREGWI